MNGNLSLRRAQSTDDRQLPHEPLSISRSGREVAFALTKEAFCIVVLLSSIGVWAAIWAAAGSLASAWLR